MTMDDGTYPLPASLVTARLRLRPIAEADLAFYTELHGDANVVRYLGGDGTPRTAERTRAWLSEMRSWYAQGWPAPYAIETLGGELVGRSGLSFFEVELEPSTEDGVPIATWGVGSSAPGTLVRRVLELGYVVHPEAWGKGYAPEAARRWMDYVLEELGGPRVSSVIHPENRSSVRVAEKNGLTTDGQLLRLEGRDYLLHGKEGIGG